MIPTFTPEQRRTLFTQRYTNPDADSYTANSTPLMMAAFAAEPEVVELILQ